MHCTQRVALPIKQFLNFKQTAIRSMKKFILLLLSFGIVFLSCSKFDNLDETAINNPDAEFAVPIGKANFSIRDLVEFVGDSTFIFVDPDSTIRLNYRGDLTFEDAEGALFGAINEALDAIPFAPIEDSISTLPWIAPDGLEIDLSLIHI